jgi:uncharacterized membrane protein YgcG
VRRVLASGAVVVLVLLGTVGPAYAAGPIAAFASPTNNQRFSVSTIALDVTVSMPNSGTLRGNATVSWFSPEGRPVPAATTHATNNSSSIRIHLPTNSFPWNGTYRVDVTATGRDSVIDQTDEPGGGQSQFVVDAPPAPPEKPSTAVNEQRREVTVSWNANGEPDLVGYEVQRQLGSAPWEQVTVTGTSTRTVVDQATSQAGGTYRYRVVAFRSSAEVGKLNPSAPSDTSTAKVSAPPVTTTTTTTPPDDGEEEERSGGSGSGGSTGSGSSSGSGGARTGSGSTGSTGGSSSTTLATSGKVDLSGFASLLDQARRTGQTPPAETDAGFDETLPFSARQRNGSSGESGDDVAILEEGVSDDDSGRLQSFAFLAGGLLATVLVMHLLWVRSEMHRAEVLEAVAPEPLPLPTRPRRRRPAVLVGDLAPLAPEIPHQKAK